MLPDPTMRIISWAATRAAEAVVERVADRVMKKAKARALAAVRSANRHVRSTLVISPARLQHHE